MAGTSDITGQLKGRSKAEQVLDPLNLGGNNTPPGTAQLQTQIGQNQTLQNGLAAARPNLAPQKNEQNQTSGEQADAIKQLQATANGTAGPSAAQKQLTSQAQIDAARQTAMANSLPGHSAGGTARAAQVGAADVGQTAAANGAVLGAQEQAAAQQQLVGALQGQQTQDQTAYGADVNERNTNIAQQITASGQAGTLAQQKAAADAIAAGQLAASQGAIVGAGGAALAGLATSPSTTANSGPGNADSAYVGSANPIAQPTSYTNNNPDNGVDAISDRRAKKTIKQRDMLDQVIEMAKRIRTAEAR